jgi:hypothetical protein
MWLYEDMTEKMTSPAMGTEKDIDTSFVELAESGFAAENSDSMAAVEAASAPVIAEAAPAVEVEEVKARLTAVHERPIFGRKEVHMGSANENHPDPSRAQTEAFLSTVLKPTERVSADVAPGSLTQERARSLVIEKLSDGSRIPGNVFQKGAMGAGAVAILSGLSGLYAGGWAMAGVAAGTFGLPVLVGSGLAWAGTKLYQRRKERKIQESFTQTFGTAAPKRESYGDGYTYR